MAASRFCSAVIRGSKENDESTEKGVMMNNYKNIFRSARSMEKALYQIKGPGVLVWKSRKFKFFLFLSSHRVSDSRVSTF